MSKENIFYELPYPHVIINDFLAKSDFDQLNNQYDNLEFFEKHTDLFNFLQTNELKNKSEFDSFTSQIISVAKNHFKFDKTEKIDLFASFYRKGDFLLCHDDYIETRRIAFSYYLSDIDGGELMMHNKMATSIEKVIPVKQNCLVLFEVSQISYHEVNVCKQDGRRAFTGWLHHNLQNKNNKKIIKKLDSKFDNTSFRSVALGNNIFKQHKKIAVLPIQLFLNKEILPIECPFYEQRVESIIGSEFVFNLKGYNLCNKSSFHVRKNDYILLNSIFNDKVDLHMFYFESEDEQEVIKFIKHGKVEFEIESIDKHLFIIKGGKWFLECSPVDFYMECWSYKLAKGKK